MTPVLRVSKIMLLLRNKIEARFGVEEKVIIFPYIDLPFALRLLCQRHHHHLSQGNY
jgi:hypothetical protein